MTIAERIAEFLAMPDRSPGWAIKPEVRRWNFLPLYGGWWSILGIRPDGSFVRWDIENDRDVIKPLPEPFLKRLALCQGAKKYPELRSLVPARPVDAVTCEHCKGEGDMPGLPQIVCHCGGCGWMILGESRGENPG